MKKNVAGQVVGAQLVSKTDGSDVTSGTTTVYVTGNGGTQSSGGGTVTHEGNGFWSYAPTQAETNYDHIAFTFVNTSAVTASVQVYTTFPQTGDAYAETQNGTYGLSAIETLVDDLESRLTATRAGYLDALQYLPAATAGTAGGLLIAGSNAGTTTFGALTCTGALTLGSLTNNGTTTLTGRVTMSAGMKMTASTPDGWTFEIENTAASGTGGTVGLFNIGSGSGGSLYGYTNYGPTVNLVSLSGTALEVGNATLGTVTMNVTGNITGNLSGSVGSVTGAVGSVTGNVGGNVAGSVGSVTGAVGSVTGNVGGNVTGSVGSVATGGITAASIATGAIDADALATDAVSEIADGVWDEAISGHLTGGSTGAALNAAGSAGDPWSTPLPGAYSSGTAGYIVGTNVDALISSRSTYAGGDTAGTTTLLSRLTSTRAGYLDNLSGGAVALASSILDAAGIRAALGLASANLDTQFGDLPTAVENADALLGRNIAGGSSTGRTVSQALYFLRNKWTIAAGTLTVYGTDDTTSSWTASITQTAGNPVSASDPA
jgi:uncharacterized protein YjbJ (UPF0337 family)